MSVDITLQARDRMSQQIDAITRSVFSLNSAFEELERTSDSASSKASSSLNKVASASKVVGKGLTTVGSGLTKYITKPAIAAGAALGTIVLAKGFKRFAQIDEAKAKMVALGLSAKQAGDIVNKNALDAVMGTAYNLDEAATTAAGAFAANIRGNDLTKYLSTVTDAAAVAGVSMDEMGIIFNRVSANGKVTAMEMNQLADRGVPIWQYLADETGKSIEEVRKDVSAGSVDLALFRRALDNNIGGAAKRMGKISWSGMVSNLEASLGRIGANIWGATDDVNSLSHTLLQLGNDAMGPLETVEGKAAELGQTLGGAARLLTEFFKGGGVKSDTFKEVSQGARDLYNTLQPIASRIRAVSGALSEMPTGKKLSLAGLAVGLGPTLKLAGRLSTTFGAVAPRIGRMVTQMGGLRGVMAGIINPLTVGAALFAGMFMNSESFRNSLGEVAATVGPQLGEAFSALGPALSSIFGMLSSVLGALGDAFAPIISAAAPVLSSLIGLFGSVVGAITPIISTIANLVSWFSSKMSGPAQTAASIISGAFRGVAGAINAVAGAINAVKSAWDSIKSGTKTLTIQRNVTGSTGVTGGNGLAGPKFATGTKSAEGGTALVGERGPELVDLPKGASVHPARETAAMRGQSVVNVSIVANVSDKGMSVDEFLTKITDEVGEAVAAGVEGEVAA